MKAHEWDGVGPKRDCLLRLVWGFARQAHTEWVHFEWEDEDGDYDEEGRVCGTPDRYKDMTGDVTVFENWHREFEPSDGFTVTHWAELPKVSP